jgi:hypothetical protein
MEKLLSRMAKSTTRWRSANLRGGQAAWDGGRKMVTTVFVPSNQGVCEIKLNF